MRIGFRIGATTLALAAAALALVPSAPGAGAAQGPTPISFSHGRWVDIQRLGAEPEIKSDSAGNLYVTAPIGVQYAHSFLWKSEDGGASYDLLRASPPMQRPMPSAGAGDATMAIVPGPAGSKDDAVVWSDMINLAGLANAATFDGGNTFPPDYWNLFASDPGADRQWLTGTVLPGTNTVRIYTFYDQVDIGGNSILYSDDYGKSWTVANREQGLGSPNPGNIAADPVNRKLYAATISGGNAVISVCDLNGQNCEEHVAGSGKGSLANLFDVVAVDRAGNVYVTFSESSSPYATYLSVSTDQGETWHQSRVSPPDQGATGFPWIVAGDAGRVWVTWYGTATKAALPSNRGPWNVYGAQSLNATSANPTFQVTKISEHPTHDNEICLSGIACTAGAAEDRNMLDDFTSAIDPNGMLHVVYNDTNNQVTLSTDKDAGGGFIVEAAQLSGPSLYANVGEVTPSPDAPVVSSAGASGGVLSATGSQTLPPGNWARDAAGDARLPRHASGGPGANDPALDIRSVSVGPGTGGSARAHVELGGALAPTTGGGKAVVYAVLFWAPPGNVYYAAAEFEGGQYVTGWIGQPDPSVVNTAGVVKIATYQPVPSFTTTTTVTYDAAKKTLDFPIGPTLVGNPAPGTRFDNLTAFSFVLNGPPGSEALMDEVDATPSTSWAWGEAPVPAGSVQLSVDDPTFANPTIASLTDYPGSSWSAAVPVTGLAAGTHTLYVRQVASGFASASTAVTFSV
ncbi:MAG: sialidase family protein [Actinomycetota bacterium]